jgi:hypothetical protein
VAIGEDFCLASLHLGASETRRPHEVGFHSSLRRRLEQPTRLRLPTVLLLVGTVVAPQLKDCCVRAKRTHHHDDLGVIRSDRFLKACRLFRGNDRSRSEIRQIIFAILEEILSRWPRFTRKRPTTPARVRRVDGSGHRPRDRIASPSSRGGCVASENGDHDVGGAH